MRRMNFRMLDTLFNAALLVFWIRIWNRDDRSAFFNPFLAPLSRLTDGIVRFLRPVFFSTPDRVIAAVALLFLALLRGAAAPREGLGWVLRMGFEVRRSGPDTVAVRFAFSTLSFAIFVFKLWGVALLTIHTRGTPSRHSAAALHALSHPFTAIRIEWRPIALVAFGAMVAALLCATGDPVVVLGQAGGGLAFFFRCLLSALSALVGVLLVLQQFVILLIIGSWVSMLASSPGVTFFCREWLDLALGPFRRFPLRIGMFDLTPLIFIFAVGFLHSILLRLLAHAYATFL